jgi:hypothetical protein
MPNMKLFLGNEKSGSSSKNEKNGKQKNENEKTEKKTSKKRIHEDTDSEKEELYDSEEDSDYTEQTEDDSDNYETVSSYEDTDDDATEDDDESTEEDEEPEIKIKSNKKPKLKRRIIETEDDETEDDDAEDYSSRGKLQKVVSELFPSKYSKDRAEKTIKKEEYNSRNSRKPDKEKKTKHKSKKSKKELEEDSENSEEEYNDIHGEDRRRKQEDEVFNILFELDDYETQEDEYIDDDDDECNSDDEKKFMKEMYEHVEIPEKEKKEKSKKKNKKSSKNEKKKSNEIEETDDDTEIDTIGKEYLELVDTKKHLIDQLKNKPKSKVLRNAVQDCNDSIKKLVQKSRTKNAKKYHKLIHSGKKSVNEINYFKKNLSNNEQMRIMKDLKEINKHINIEKPYRLALLESKIPAKYKATALQKLNILRSMEPGDNEYYKIKSWVDTFMRIPFGMYKSLSVNIDDGIDVCHDFMEKSMKTLDECVYGLNNAKLQIMQLIGQWITNPSSVGSAIAIHGPPGCGKTSIVKDGISKILGREFAFISLGGTGDSSFLEGHSYTYEGSNCGKIVQILMESRCMNPVIYFDELDKISETPRGEEIAGILTHLTDTTQNSQFHDKYFSEVEFDLSKCLFIFSYNDESKVNPILRDRMYRIETKGYESKEKIIIARDYLLPKIREQVKMSEEEVIISDDIINYLASSEKFTKGESGVRNLKRCLEIIYTKLNLFRLTKPNTNLFGKDIDIKVEFPFTVSKKHVDIFIKNEETQNQSLMAMYV